MPQILIVDPEPKLSHELTGLLAYSGDEITWLRSGAEAQARLASSEPMGALIIDAAVDGGDVLPLIQAVKKRAPILLLTEPLDPSALIERSKQGIDVSLIKPVHGRELVLWLHALMRGRTRVVCIGGGTGLYTLLLGLKTLPNVYISAVVNMSDDGGSSGRIREAFGMLPPGDIRRCLVALSTAPALMNELLQYRFQEGEGLSDHNLGNLLLTAMTRLTGSMSAAVRAMSDILHTQGIVLPATDTLCTLNAELENGAVIRGEHKIDVPSDRDPNLRIRRLWHEPVAEANPQAVAAILAADVVTIGPGDLYTSILATLQVRGIAEAVRSCRGKKIYIGNLMTKPGETSGFSVSDHVRAIAEPIGGDHLDAVLVSSSPVSEEARRLYSSKGQEPVTLDAQNLPSLTRAALWCRDIGKEQELVRHDSGKLANEIARLIGMPGSPAVKSRA